MPKSADYIRNKFCYADYESCNRFRIFSEFGGEQIPPDLDPSDTEEVNKIVRCLRSKNKPGDTTEPDRTPPEGENS